MIFFSSVTSHNLYSSGKYRHFFPTFSYITASWKTSFFSLLILSSCWKNSILQQYQKSRTILQVQMWYENMFGLHDVFRIMSCQITKVQHTCQWHSNTQNSYKKILWTFFNKAIIFQQNRKHQNDLQLHFGKIVCTQILNISVKKCNEVARCFLKCRGWWICNCNGNPQVWPCLVRWARWKLLLIKRFIKIFTTTTCVIV